MGEDCENDVDNNIANVTSEEVFMISRRKCELSTVE